VHGCCFGEGGAGRAESVGMVEAEAGRCDVLQLDGRRCGQAGTGQLGRREGRRLDEGTPSVRPSARPPVHWCGGRLGRGGRLADCWLPLRLCPVETF
jgi:hypothetical protein